MDISIYRDREFTRQLQVEILWCFVPVFLDNGCSWPTTILFLILNCQAIYLYINIYYYIYMLHFIYNIILYSYIVIFTYSYIYASTFQQTRYCLCHYLWRVFSTQRTVQNGSQSFIWHVWERFRTVLGSRKSENGSERFRTVPELSCSDRPGWQERFRTVLAMAGLVLCFKNRL